jgi:hypothetical protein
VLVEGELDVEVLTHVAELSGRRNLRFIALPQLDSSEPRGGKDTIIGYVRKSGSLIQNRIPDAPLVLLFDWDVSSQELERARKGYGNGAADRVMSMNPAHADAALGEDVRGIERFYPVRVFKEAHQAREIVVGFGQTGSLSVAPQQLNQGKGALRRRVLGISELSELTALVKVLEDVDRAVESARTLQRMLF